jgi:hypothetical protein
LGVFGSCFIALAFVGGEAVIGRTEERGASQYGAAVWIVRRGDEKYFAGQVNLKNCFRDHVVNKTR